MAEVASHEKRQTKVSEQLEHLSLRIGLLTTVRSGWLFPLTCHDIISWACMLAYRYSFWSAYIVFVSWTYVVIRCTYALLLEARV